MSIAELLKQGEPSGVVAARCMADAACGAGMGDMALGPYGYPTLATLQKVLQATGLYLSVAPLLGIKAMG